MSGFSPRNIKYMRKFAQCWSDMKKAASGMHKKQLKMGGALPPIDSDMPRREIEIERQLTTRIQKFLLELGQGFAFVGRQVHLEVGGQDFYIDLLFYHLKLRCYVVIELKACDFEPGLPF